MLRRHPTDYTIIWRQLATVLARNASLDGDAGDAGGLGSRCGVPLGLLCVGGDVVFSVRPEKDRGKYIAMGSISGEQRFMKKLC